MSGVSDETVVHLANLAFNGVITPASAARLAIRHAIQLQTPRSQWRGRADRNFGISRLQVAMAGDPFGNYALCYGPTEAGLWIGSAPVRNMDFLPEVCPKSGCGFFVLVGIDSRRRPVAGILDAIRRPCSLKGLLRTERWRFVEHVLVVGGQIPTRSQDQRLLLCDVREAVRRSGYARVIGSRATGAARPEGLRESPLAPDALLLLELAFPGLVACREQVGDPE